jgi:cysteine-rich repeat protein
MTGTSDTATTDATVSGSDTNTTGPATATDTDSGTTMAPPAVCGDGVVEGTEECDSTPGCEADCTLSPAVCGNGTVEAGEVCDDMNTMDGDECSADCQMVTIKAVCGNGMVEGDEVCDDGNQVAGDGCENDCTISPPVCGNGMVEGDEACDDGNKVNGGPGDFCKNDCTVFVPASCQAPAMYTNCDADLNLGDKANKKNALKAIGICDGELATSIVTTDFQFESNDKAWQVAKGFGSYKYDKDMNPMTPDELLYAPREGSSFLIVSTGTVNAPNGQTGIVTHAVNSQVQNGDNGNNDTDALPAPFQVKVGSNNGAGGTPFKTCDGVNDCSDTLQAQWTKGNSNPNDRLWFTFKTKVPAGTFGYTFDFVFCSAEWPTYVNTGFNDLLIAYQVDPSADDPNANPPVDPYTGNVTFIPDPNDATKGLPLTITALDPYLKGPGFSNNEPQLAGTGFETHACSDWFSAKGGVQPGAEITIGFYIADMSDSILATMAILDNFRWDCEGCVPSEVDDCGVQQPM